MKMTTVEKLEALGIEKISEFLCYDPSSPSGLRWIKNNNNCIKSGRVAGYKNPRGYWSVRLSGHFFLAHHLVMILNESPPVENMQIDHIDRNPSNNRFENLRWVYSSDNNKNRCNNRQILSKYPYLQWTKRNRKWKSTVWYEGKTVHVGYFKEESEGYKAAVERLRGLGVSEDKIIPYTPNPEVSLDNAELSS
jgi:hypothetical protein